MAGVDRRQASGLEHTEAKGTERLVKRDAVIVVGRVGHNGIDGLVRQVGERLSEVTGAKLPRVAAVLGRSFGCLGPDAIHSDDACSLLTQT